MRLLTSFLPPMALCGSARALAVSPRQAPGQGGAWIYACSNPDYQPLSDTVTCQNFSNPTRPMGYGGRTCRDLTGTSLSVGAPQGISSVRASGGTNCTLYKTPDCLPDTPDNGFVIPPGGASALPPGIDDQTVALNCRPLTL